MRNEGVTLFSNKFLFRILVPLVFILSLIQPTIANGQTFIWPVNQSHTISQDYAVYNDGKPNKYHTGIDLYTDNLEVYVAANGWVHDIKYDDAAWGNAIILRHPSGEYSVYAHLEKFSQIFTKGQWLTLLPSRTQLGIMGETGDVDGIHLHFAIKSNGSWGVGYTQDIPDGYDYGFRDPKVYISPFSAMSINPIAVKIVNGPLKVRTGPDITYSMITTVTLDQKFIAFGKSGNWYQIYLPNANGFTSGWIAGIYSGTTFAIEDPSATKIEVQNVGLSGLKIRSGPGTSFPEIKINKWDIIILVLHDSLLLKILIIGTGFISLRVLELLMVGVMMIL